jgi:hypothetical protein
VSTEVNVSNTSNDSDNSNSFFNFYFKLRDSAFSLVNLQEKEFYEPAIIQLMYALLGLPLRKYPIVIGDEKYGTRMHCLIAIRSGNGKNSFIQAIKKFCDKFNYTYAPIASLHEEQLIGKLKINEKKETFESPGYFRFDFIVLNDSLLLLNEKKYEKIREYFIRGCDESFSNEIMKKQVDMADKIGLRYNPEFVCFLFVQDKLILKSNVDTGFVRKVPMLAIDPPTVDYDMLMSRTKKQDSNKSNFIYSLTGMIRNIGNIKWNFDEMDEIKKNITFLLKNKYIFGTPSGALTIDSNKATKGGGIGRFFESKDRELTENQIKILTYLKLHEGISNTSPMSEELELSENIIFSAFKTLKNLKHIRQLSNGLYVISGLKGEENIKLEKLKVFDNLKDYLIGSPDQIENKTSLINHLAEELKLSRSIIKFYFNQILTDKLIYRTEKQNYKLNTALQQNETKNKAVIEYILNNGKTKFISLKQRFQNFDMLVPSQNYGIEQTNLEKYLEEMCIANLIFKYNQEEYFICSKGEAKKECVNVLRSAFPQKLKNYNTLEKVFENSFLKNEYSFLEFESAVNHLVQNGELFYLYNGLYTGNKTLCSSDALTKNTNKIKKTHIQIDSKNLQFQALTKFPGLNQMLELVLARPNQTANFKELEFCYNQHKNKRGYTFDEAIRYLKGLEILKSIGMGNLTINPILVKNI